MRVCLLSVFVFLGCHSAPHFLAEAETSIPVWYYIPTHATPQSPILFVMHGVRRNALEYLNSWKGEAEAHNAYLLAPEFPKSLVRHYGRTPLYETGSEPLLENLFDTARKKFHNESTTYLLYGHSAGGQYVHRFMLMNPKARVKRAVAANSGWYTMPDWNVEMPYGLKSSSLSSASLKDALECPLTVLLGEKDTRTDDENFVSTPEAMAQGPTRLERGRRFFENARAKAKEIGVDFRWNLKTVPGVGHSNQKMLHAAAEILFAK